ncbi:MAG: tRNA (adenine(22)-N(1))-methyltransferase TrmK [Alphaproteobacteria bacterium]|nr:tRNA (adenine(22)-N(1))-methyltransferase TrmK [Alphaproteobacteria bacterium]
MSNTEFTIELAAGVEGFGSGDHPSTQMVLQALYALQSVYDFSHIIDMGSGAGLLAMTAANLWPESKVVAADIQASAVAMAQKNIAHNHLEKRVEVVRSNGYNHSQIRAQAPYDLVICNMTADPLVMLASGLRSSIASGSIVILSGILLWRSAEILAVHAQIGLQPLLPVMGMEDWETHVLIQQDMPTE